MLKNQQYREIAEQKMEAERKKIFELQNDSPNVALESTAMSAQIEATSRILRPSCLNVSSENDLKSMPGREHHDAVSYWSHELKTNQKPHFPATGSKRGSLFHKCTSFTNQIEDSRVRHSEAHETVSSE
jgi:hypothetical protein